VQVLNPDMVNVQWADPGRTFRKYTYGTSTELPTFAIRHLALSLLPSMLIGRGPIQAIASTVQDAVDSREYARDLWNSGGVPSGKLIHPSKLTKEEAQLLAEQWDLAHGGGSRVTGVLSGGMDYEVLSFSADQLQALQSRAFTVAEIARALGIPAHLLNAATGVAGASGAAMTYQNVVMVWRELLGTTLKPVYGQRLAEAMSSFLPRGTSVMFDYSDFMEDDQAARFNSYQVALSAGFMTVDEVRAKEGMAPSPELEAEKQAKRELATQIAGGKTDEDAEPSGTDSEQ
jgi:HK97 family phage portal protein